jgi:hypothetical protein
MSQTFGLIVYKTVSGLPEAVGTLIRATKHSKRVHSQQTKVNSMDSFKPQQTCERQAKNEHILDCPLEKPASKPKGHTERAREVAIYRVVVCTASCILNLPFKPYPLMIT